MGLSVVAPTCQGASFKQMMCTNTVMIPDVPLLRQLMMRNDFDPSIQKLTHGQCLRLD